MHRMNLTTIGLRFKQESLSKALRVRAVGNLHGWYFIISDADRNVVARSIGELPAYYSGLEWNEQTATLYALNQASRHIQENFPRHHVALVCAAPNLRTGQGRERTWAA